MPLGPGISAKSAHIRAMAERTAKEHQRKDKLRRERFGHVHPAIHADFKGHKVVAIGDEVVLSEKWRTFPDFLTDYIKRVLGPAWRKAELAKPFDERHQIMKLYDGMCRFQQKCEAGSGDLFEFVPNGPTRAYLLLAYDLYTLKHHMALRSAVIKRLKHNDQFQGARHELFAAATCIRAGYDVAYEDERDSTRRHTELIASHRGTGQQIAVEAKSRHRPGVWNRPGTPEPPSSMRVGIYQLLKDALDKPVSHPYVIFVDLNLPPFDSSLIDTPWFPEIGNAVTDLGDKVGTRDPFNLVVLSNQPDHYRTDDAPAVGGQSVSMFGRNPRLVPSHPGAILAIHEAANKFGTIPNWFEEAGGD